MRSMMQMLLSKFDARFDEKKNKFDKLSIDFDNRFDKLSNEIHEQKVKCESNFNELKKQNNELKNDINEINKRCESTNEIFKNNFNKLEQNIERMGVGGINIGKNNTDESDGNICINSSGSSLDAKQVMVDQVSNSDNYNNELMLSLIHI